MKSKSKSTNYFFEYKIELFKDDLGIFKKDETLYPRLYLERNHQNENLNYELYMTIPSWYEAKTDLDKESLLFNTVEIQYDIRGIDNSSLEKRAQITNVKSTEKIEIANKIIIFDAATGLNKVSKVDYRNNSYRIVIVDGQYEDYSGAGQIKLYNSKKPDQCAIFYVAVNFLYKRKISYSIRKQRGGYEVEFVADKITEKIPVKVLKMENNYPCLKQETEVDRDIEIEFDSKGKYTKLLSFKNVQDDNILLNIVFDTKNKDFSKYYLLDCLQNDTLRIEKDATNIIAQELICPYCHRPIKITTKKDAKYDGIDALKMKEKIKNYKKGGISCQGEVMSLPNNNKFIKLLDVQGKIKKECIYCEEDYKDDENIRYRALPDKMLTKQYTKIAVLGANRAGKSTYISRLFDIENDTDNSFSINHVTMFNAFSKLFPKYKSLSFPEVKSYNPSTLQETTMNFSMNSKFYEGYKIGCGYKRRAYPNPTSEGATELYRCPFIINYNQNYVGFYDIAGETAKKGDVDILGRITTATDMGIFCIINPSKTQESIKGNEQVIDKIISLFPKDVDTMRHTPVAVILTKFDAIADQFDCNSNCVRDDLYDIENEQYENSYLKRSIDMSSIEIDSYITINELASINKLKQNFNNVKFFGVSSFSNGDAFMENKQKTKSEENYLNFKCDSFKLELPVIWMLKQLGIII